MNIQIILIILGLTLVFLLAFKLLKGIIKAIISVVIISIILIGVFGIIIYTDTIALKKGFEGEKTIVITDDQLLITAFKLSPDVSISSAIKQEYYETLTLDEIDNLFEKINDEDYDEIEKNGLLLVMDQKVFYEENTTNEEIKLNKKILEDFSKTTNTDDALKILKDEKIITEQESTILKKQNLHEIKSNIYYSLFMTNMEESKGKFIIQEIKNKNVHIVPELLSIKMINYFPEKIMNKIIKIEE